jgi:fructose-1,6-bisphosphatase II / sedoheptulose-1,7-bisphosphatase
MKLHYFIQERILGTKNGPDFDIAVDPVEGTNFVANNLPGGIAGISSRRKRQSI